MERVGCYTTARVSGGRVERLERHAGRLRRDAERLGLALPERPAIEGIALAAVGAELGRSDGIVRIEWSVERSPGTTARIISNDSTGATGTSGAAQRSDLQLSATLRPLGREVEAWRAITAQALHPGPGSHRGAKALGVAAYEAARAEQAEGGVDECLLFDAAGRLVEGSRTNLIVVTADGFCLTPARGLGPVEGLGLECAREAVEAIRETLAIDRRELARARELVAVNAVRGAVAIVELDGSAIADGRPGPLAQRLRALFATGRSRTRGAGAHRPEQP